MLDADTSVMQPFSIHQLKFTVHKNRYQASGGVVAMFKGLGDHLFPLGAISATWPGAIMPMLSRVPQQYCGIREVITHRYITQDLRPVYVPFYTRYRPLTLPNAFFSP